MLSLLQENIKLESILFNNIALSCCTAETEAMENFIDLYVCCGCEFVQRACVCSKLIIIIMIFNLQFFFFLFRFYVSLCLLLSIFLHHLRCSHHSIHVEIIINTCSWLRLNCECAKWNVVGNLWYILFEFYLFRGRSSRIAIPGNNFRSRFNLSFF